jgi:hypothetical protein
VRRGRQAAEPGRGRCAPRSRRRDYLVSMTDEHDAHRSEDASPERRPAPDAAGHHARRAAARGVRQVTGRVASRAVQRAVTVADAAAAAADELVDSLRPRRLAATTRGGGPSAAPAPRYRVGRRPTPLPNLYDRHRRPDGASASRLIPSGGRDRRHRGRGTRAAGPGLRPLPAFGRTTGRAGSGSCGRSSAWTRSRSTCCAPAGCWVTGRATASPRRGVGGSDRPTSRRCCCRASPPAPERAARAGARGVGAGRGGGTGPAVAGRDAGADDP